MATETPWFDADYKFKSEQPVPLDPDVIAYADEVVPNLAPQYRDITAQTIPEVRLIPDEELGVTAYDLTQQAIYHPQGPRILRQGDPYSAHSNALASSNIESQTVYVRASIALHVTQMRIAIESAEPIDRAQDTDLRTLVSGVMGTNNGINQRPWQFDTI